MLDQIKILAEIIKKLLEKERPAYVYVVILGTVLAVIMLYRNENILTIIIFSLILMLSVLLVGTSYNKKCKEMTDEMIKIRKDSEWIINNDIYLKALIRDLLEHVSEKEKGRILSSIIKENIDDKKKDENDKKD